MRCMWFATSKLRSFTHNGRSSPKGTSFTRQANRGASGRRSSISALKLSKPKWGALDASKMSRPPVCWCHVGRSIDRKMASEPEIRSMKLPSKG